MLGWFKKKFRKKESPSTSESTSTEIQEESISKQEQSAEQNITPAEPDLSPSPAESGQTDTPVKEPVQEKETVAEPEAPPQPIEQKSADLQQPAPPASEPAPSKTTEADHTLEKTEPEPVVADVPEQPAAILQPADEEEAQEPEAKKDQKESLFSRLTSRLGKTRESLTYQMDALFLGKKEIDSDLLDSLEEILITADLGVETAEELIEYARKKVKRKELLNPDGLKNILKDQIKKYILANEADATLVMPKSGPFVIMVIGVNGVGKTTSIGKIAHKFKQSGNSVMLVAADTFRAAAVSQLQIWGERNDIPVIAHDHGADPSSVVFDALSSALASDVDVVIVDTAGRMHTKENLMEELKKIKRVIGKKLRGAPHEVMLVIDATTGQNAISQARLFDAAVDITGLTLTKLDGTSKGGIVANICRDIKVPIRFIGIGEQMDDLRDFDATEFVDALFQSDK